LQQLLELILLLYSFAISQKSKFKSQKTGPQATQPKLLNF
jgi:hypothetical protein